MYYTFSKAYQEFHGMIKLQSWTAEELLENETGIQSDHWELYAMSLYPQGSQIKTNFKN